MSNIETLDAVIDSVQPLLTKLSAMDKERNLLARQIATTVSAVKLEPNEDHEEEDMIIEILNDVSDKIGMIWEGHWSAYDDWNVGDSFNFWVPSTC